MFKLFDYVALTPNFVKPTRLVFICQQAHDA
jgi:hypothetical protein